jgi:DNA-binding NtrC family response regulator
MEIIFTVPYNFIKQQVLIDKINKVDCKLEPLSINKIYTEDINLPINASFIFNLDNLKIDDYRFWDTFKKQYPDNISIGITKEKSIGGDNFDSIHELDEIISLNYNNQNSLLKVCKKIQYLSQIKCVQKNICQKLKRNFIVGKSLVMKELISNLPKYANSEITVLLSGETGTGKELFARAFHYLGKRSGKPFVTVDCSTLPESLAENELFGHVKEAYTNANNTQKGLLDDANEGTVFFDEIESLPLYIQKKLLRFIQEHEIKPVGSTKYKKIDVRIIAASNENLQQLVNERKFRKDLFYRLNVAEIHLPAIRNRREDIYFLIDFFFKEQTKKRCSIKDVPQNIVNKWLQYDWPGNVREIENEVKKWLIRRDDNHLSDQIHPVIVNNPPDDSVCIDPLKEFRSKILLKHERCYLINLLKFTKSNISKAAKIAGINRKNFGNLLKKYDINRHILE